MGHWFPGNKCPRFILYTFGIQKCLCMQCTPFHLYVSMGLFIGSVMNEVLFNMSWEVMESRIAFNMLPSDVIKFNYNSHSS